MNSSLPFTTSSQTLIAPMSYGCSSMGDYGVCGFCQFGAGGLPTAPGFPPPPATGAQDGTLPTTACVQPQMPSN